MFAGYLDCVCIVFTGALELNHEVFTGVKELIQIVLTGDIVGSQSVYIRLIELAVIVFTGDLLITMTINCIRTYRVGNVDTQSDTQTIILLPTEL